jgi:hypothetical protein
MRGNAVQAVLGPLLLLAAASAASLSPWLALAGAWALLIVLLLAAINAYRSRVEQTMTEVVVGRIQRNGFIRYKQPKEYRP